MDLKQDLRFEEFRLDRRNQELRRDSNLIALRPKTFAVLQYLAENPARLITQEELLNAVWGPIAVGDGLLRGYVRDLRQALGDDATNPRFIETMPRRGFRFLPKVSVESGRPADLEPGLNKTLAPPPTELVGRDQELSSLDRLMASALGGKRQMVFIAGEAGIGKTALLQSFLGNIAGAGDARTVCGHCVEQFGTREPYLPIFDALTRLCSDERADEALTVLAQYAPSWLAQVPGLISGDQFQALQKRVQGTTQARMLGEFCEALEALATDQLFVLGLEDLQWTDLATLDLLSIVARREHRARLMVIGTYRPADVIVSNHPLRAVLHDLQAHRQCTELWPENLTEDGVDSYLGHRFQPHEFPPKLKQLIHRNTAGNPLFVTSIVDELIRDKLIEDGEGRWHLTADAEHLETWKSASLRHLIEGQLSRLSADEQRLLEVAAVVGSAFDSDLVAAALEIDPVEAEERCDRLVHRLQILRTARARSDERADGHSRYEFIHDLYRNAAFDQSSQGRRRHWYKRIAEKMTADFGDRADEAATELAYYFEHAGMTTIAAQYCATAGERASRQFADAEALGQFLRGIDLLKNISASKERDALELRLKVALAAHLSKTQGYESSEIVELLGRTIDLTQELDDTVEAFGPMRFLHFMLSGRAEHRQAYQLCDKLNRLAEKTGDPILGAEVGRMRGQSAFFLGHCSEARESYEEAIATHHREDRKAHPFAYIEDPDAEVHALSVLSNVLWINGYPEQALQRAEAACAIAKESGILYSIAVAGFFLNDLMYFLRDIPATLKQAELGIALCTQHGFTLWLGQARLLHGWALAMRGRTAEGIKELETAFANGALAGGGSIGWLVDAYLHTRKTSKGLIAVERGLKLTQEHEEGAWEPDLHRLKGELLLQRADVKGRKHTDDIDLAERCFLTAIERARNNNARSYELRAAMSLYRLWSKQGKRPEARRILADVYDWFTEGKNTPDLVDARRLLDKPRA